MLSINFLQEIYVIDKFSLDILSYRSNFHRKFVLSVNFLYILEVIDQIFIGNLCYRFIPYRKFMLFLLSIHFLKENYFFLKLYF